jgi:ABC-type iron transport system FetAB permease component
MNQLVVQPDIPNPDEPELTWVNVGIALAFILVDGSPLPSSSLIQVVFSISLGLGIEKSILVASVRCLVQLTVMVTHILCI